MKIAMIGHKRIPSREGGIEIVVEKLVTQLIQNGHTVDVYNRRGRHVSGGGHAAGTREKYYQGARIYSIPTLSARSLNAVVYAFLASVACLFHRYDIVHYHAEGPASMLVIPHFFGKKTVVTIHGLDWQRDKWGGFATKYLMHGERIAVRYADEIIVLTRSAQEYFRERYHRETVFIPNGLDAPVCRAPCEITKRYGLNGGDYLLYLGRIVPEKGITYLLEAYRRLDTDVRLVIVGGGSHSGEYVSQVRQLAMEDSRVLLTGFLEGDILGELLSNCLLYIQPSDVEGMPLSLLEAISHNRRCLVSDIPENVETVTNFGANYRTFPKGNIESLAEQLEQALTGGEWGSEDASAGRGYTWDEIARQTLDLYQNTR